MKISLRKANIIQNQIREVVKGITSNPAVSINEFQLVEDQINTAKQAILTAIARKDSLLNVLYLIRTAVAKANADSGINASLTTLASYDRTINQYNDLAIATVILDSTVINGKLDKIRNSKEDPYFRERTVETGVFNVEELAQFKTIANTTRKNKQALQDAILELNIRTEIDLSAEVVEVLQKESIL